MESFLLRKFLNDIILYVLLSRKKVLGQRTTAELIVVIETCLSSCSQRKKSTNVETKIRPNPGLV